MKEFDFPQYSPEWWAQRRGVPTSSRFDSIITPAKGELSKQHEDYACQLIADGYDAFYGQPEEYVNAAMNQGTIMEPEARAYYEFERDQRVRQIGFCMTDDGRFGCSPDALVGDCGVLELKCPQPATQIRYIIDNCLPTKYRCQVHGHLFVTGREWADFMSYLPGYPPVLVRVERDKFTELLGERLNEFWDKYQTLKRRVALQREDAIVTAIARQAPVAGTPLGAFVTDPEPAYF